MDTENTHYCPTSDYYRIFGWGEFGLRATLWHIDRCTCRLVDDYNFFMVEQDDHVRAYFENLGWLKVHYSSRYGVGLEYPSKDDGFMSHFLDVHYPYPSKRDLEIREIRHKQWRERDRKIESARRRKHLRVLWWRKRR